MYEESQNQLHSAENELDRMKQYLNEVLKEVARPENPEKIPITGIEQTKKLVELLYN
jgi:hypothetical protein